MAQALLRLLVVLGVTLGSVAAGVTQTFPARTITLVVPAAPGGVTDVIARALGQRLGQNLGVPVIVENKPGASNQIAAELVARAPADGSTLLVSPEATFVINPICSPSFTTIPPTGSCRSLASSRSIKRSSPIRRCRRTASPI